MKVNAVTVTYGDRFHLLEQVLDSVLREQVDVIWVMDNNSAPSSQAGLQEKAKQHSQIKVITFSENLGSAGAYCHLLERVYSESENSFFWLLDDDNVVLPGALSSLITSYYLLEKDLGRPVLYSYRGEAGKEDPNAVTIGLIKGPRLNSFCGFEIADLIKRKKKPQSNILSPDQINYPMISVQWGPYGGMFSDLENFRRIGLPKKELVVYADDQEFSYRFFKLSIPQFLIYASRIQDIDHSVGDGGGYFGANTSLFKIFYGLRNTTYLSKQMAKNGFVYGVNKWVFLTVMGLLGIKYYLRSPQIVRQRLPWIWRAFRDGEGGKLGKVNFR